MDLLKVSTTRIILKKNFNLGPQNDWKKNLDKKYIKKIETSFKNEMRELGYI